MLEKIKQIEDRYEEINQLLANPEISKDHIKVRDLIKEQTKIKSVANLSTELGKVEREIQETILSPTLCKFHYFRGQFYRKLVVQICETQLEILKWVVKKLVWK